MINVRNVTRSSIKEGWCAVCEGRLCSKCPEEKKNWLKVGSGVLPRFMHKRCWKRDESQLIIHKKRASLPKTFSYVKSVRSLRGMSKEDEEEEEEEMGKEAEGDEPIDDIFEDAPPLESHQEPHDHDEVPELGKQVHEAAPKSLIDDDHSTPITIRITVTFKTRPRNMRRLNVRRD